jgi:hypothetical protein
VIAKCDTPGLTTGIKTIGNKRRQQCKRKHSTATKEDITVRLVPLANHGVHIDTPTVTAITAKDATDAETLRIIDVLTIQP